MTEDQQYELRDFLKENLRVTIDSQIYDEDNWYERTKNPNRKLVVKLQIRYRADEWTTISEDSI